MERDSSQYACRSERFCNDSSPLSKHLVSGRSTPTAISIPMTLTFHHFLRSQVRFKYLSIFSISSTFSYYSLWESFTLAFADVPLLEFEDKFPLVSSTFLSILADLNAVVWMIFSRPPISNCPSSLSKPLGILPSAPITINIKSPLFSIACSVLWQGLSTCLFLVSLIFHSVILQDGKVYYSAASLFLLFNYHLVNLVTVIDDNPKTPFSIASKPRCRRWCDSFPWIAPLFL